jgi:Ca2+-binding RTX toxin-like protein
MIDHDVAGHEGIGDGTPTTRMNNKGYFGLLGENIGSSGSTGPITELSRAIDIFENLFIDTSVAGRGHRLNILRADYREAGIGEVVGIFTDGGTDFNTVMQTTNFGARAGKVFLTGVAINDTDNDNFYDVGQGHGGVKVTVRFGGATVGSDTTEAAGGYAAAVAAGKPYMVSFSGGGLPSPVSVSVVGVTQNVKIDLLGTNEILSSTSTVLGAGAKILGLLGVSAINGVGNALANAITGNKAANSLNGAAGNDSLAGGGGADRLTGGVGKDVTSGGLANDIFDFNALGEMGKTALTRDRIADFGHLADRIDLSTIDVAMGPGNQKFAFIGTGAFTGVKGQLHYKFEGPAKTIVEGDVDGNRVADFQIELTGHKLLTAGDFIL